MKKQYLYIGNCSEKGIIKYKFDDNKLEYMFSTNDFSRCTYLAQTSEYIYTTQEICDLNNKNSGYIIFYKKNLNNLNFIGKIESLGSYPCHIELSNKNGIIFISNYMDGYFTAYKIEKNGTFGNKLLNEVIDKNKSHMHCCKLFNDEKNLITIDLGTNIVAVYSIYSNTVKKITQLQLPENTEPRHISVYNNIIFLITEKSCELYVLELKNNQLQILRKISILPPDYIKKDSDTGAAIKISKDGKYIYSTIRGHNSISVFKYEDENIKFIQNISSYGQIPRDLEIDKTQKYVFVANQNSDEIAIFKRNIETGKLSYMNSYNVPSPTCILVE